MNSFCKKASLLMLTGLLALPSFPSTSLAVGKEKNTEQKTAMTKKI